jgi:hypothetical protein
MSAARLALRRAGLMVAGLTVGTCAYHYHYSRPSPLQFTQPSSCLPLATLHAEGAAAPLPKRPADPTIVPAMQRLVSTMQSDICAAIEAVEGPLGMCAVTSSLLGVRACVCSLGLTCPALAY